MKKSILLIALVIVSIAGFAQIDTVAMGAGCGASAAYATNENNRMWNSYSLPHPLSVNADPDIDLPTFLLSYPGGIFTNCTTCSKFRIFYEDYVVQQTLSYSGGFFDPGLGAQRRATLCAVLNYIQSVLQINTTGTNYIDIHVLQSFNSLPSGNPAYLPPSTTPVDLRGALASAAPYFPNNFNLSGAAQIFNGVAFDHITSGSKTTNCSGCGDKYDMYIRVNFSGNVLMTISGVPSSVPISFWDDYQNTTVPCRYDLFSVLLHEVTHGLGWLSNMVDNSPAIPSVKPFGTFNHFTKYDATFLQYNTASNNLSSTTNFTKFVTSTPSVNTAVSNIANSLRNNNVWLYNTNTPINQPVYSGSYQTSWQPVSAQSLLSHLNEQILSYGNAEILSPGFSPLYVMSPFSYAAQLKRSWTRQEIRALSTTGLGYTIIGLPAAQLSNQSPYATTQQNNTSVHYNDIANPDFSITNNSTGTSYIDIVLATERTAGKIADPDAADVLQVEDGTLFNIRGCGGTGNNHSSLTLLNGNTVIRYTPRTNFYGKAQFGFHLTDGKERGGFKVYTIDVLRGTGFANNPSNELILNGDYETGVEIRQTGVNSGLINTPWENGMEGRYCNGYSFSDAHPYANITTAPIEAGFYVHNAHSICFGTLGIMLGGFGVIGRTWPHNIVYPQNSVPSNSERFAILYGAKNYFTLANNVTNCNRYKLEFDVNPYPSYTTMSGNFSFDMQFFTDQVTFARYAGFVSGSGTPNYTTTVNVSVNATNAWAHVVYYFYYYGSPSMVMNLINPSVGAYIDNVSLQLDNTPLPPTLSTSQTNTALRIAANATVTISGNVTLNNCDVVMGDNAAINIPSGSTLTLTSSNAAQFTRLHSCGNMWNGITIQPGGNLIINNNSLIEDAKNAVVAVDGTSNYTIDGAIFNKNYKSIIFSPTTVAGVSTRKIVNSVFTCRVLPINPTIAMLTAPYALRGYASAALAAPYATQKSNTGIDVNRISGFLFIGVSSLPVNTFDNLVYGIWAHSSNVYIKHNTFQFIKNVLLNNQLVGGIAVAADAPVGVNNLTLQVGGTAANELNTFTGACTEAIDVTEYARVTVLYNNISYYEYTPPNFNPYAQGYYGIKMITSASKNINVAYNIISNYGTGVSGFRQGTNNSTGNYTVRGNQISGNFLAGGDGIRIQDLTPSATVSNIYIADNIISTVVSGITLVGVKASARVEKNNISINPAGLFVYADGIGLYDTGKGPGAGITLTSNTINGGVTNPIAGNINIRGIYASLSPNSIINCNTVNNTGRSFVFNNACGGTALLNNTLNTAWDGIVLTNSGIIGQQGTLSSASDNIWAGAGTTAANFVNSQTLAEASNGPSSLFYVIGTSPGYNPLIAKNKAISAGVPFSFNNTALLSSGCAAPGGGGGGGASAASSLAAASTTTVSTAFLDLQMSASPTQYPVYSTQSVIYNNQNAYEYLENNTSLKTSKYKKFSDSLSTKTIGLFNKFNNALQQNDVKLAKSINSSFTPINTIEQNQQTINKYLADGLTNGKYILARNEKSSVRAIAAQCPLTGGRAVYQARTLYNLLNGRDTTFVEKCKDNFANARLAQNNDDGDSPAPSVANSMVKLYPNPNGGSFILEYNISEATDALFEIFDVTGKRIDSVKLNGKSTLAEINESELENGIYYYRISVSGTAIAADKLVVIK